MVGLIDITTMFAKVLNKNCIEIAASMFHNVVKYCDAGLRLNQSFDQATRYRRAIRVVQKAWRSKYQARL